MWPKDAYVGQRVVALVSLSRGDSRLEKGKVYTIEKIGTNLNVVSFRLSEMVGRYRIVYHHMVKPVDESKLDVFKEILNHVPNDKNLVRVDS